MGTKWSTSDIAPLTGKVALVTGANAGLGLETAKVLAAKGAKVLLACRNAAKAEAARAEVEAGAADGGSAHVVSLDLASLASVEAAAKEVLDAEDRLDLLVNNAGLMAVDRSKTEDGFETQFGVNHLGHFALTARLAPLVLSTPGSRIGTMSSFGHRPGRMHFGDLMFEKRYDRWRPYFQSKLSNLLFSLELQRRLTEAAADTIAVTAHPGGSHTDLGYEGKGITNRLMRPAQVILQSAAQGSEPMLRALTDPGVQGGEFYGPNLMVRGHAVKEKPSRRGRDAAAARRLWDVSEELTGLTFDIPA